MKEIYHIYLIKILKPQKTKSQNELKDKEYNYLFQS